MGRTNATAGVADPPEGTARLINRELLLVPGLRSADHGWTWPTRAPEPAEEVEVPITAKVRRQQLLHRPERWRIAWSDYVFASGR